MGTRVRFEPVFDTFPRRFDAFSTFSGQFWLIVSVAVGQVVRDRCTRVGVIRRPRGVRWWC